MAYQDGYVVECTACKLLKTLPTGQEWIDSLENGTAFYTPNGNGVIKTNGILRWAGTWKVLTPANVDGFNTWSEETCTDIRVLRNNAGGL